MPLRTHSDRVIIKSWLVYPFHRGCHRLQANDIWTPNAIQWSQHTYFILRCGGIASVWPKFVSRVFSRQMGISNEIRRSMNQPRSKKTCVPTSNMSSNLVIVDPNVVPPLHRWRQRPWMWNVIQWIRHVVYLWTQGVQESSEQRAISVKIETWNICPRSMKVIIPATL